MFLRGCDKTYFASISVDVVVVAAAAVVADAVAILQKGQLTRTRTWGCISNTSLYEQAQ